MERRPKIKIGDYITFKSPTRYSNKFARRKVRGFYDLAETKPEVRFEGWDNFAVRPDEVFKIEKDDGRVWERKDTN